VLDAVENLESDSGDIVSRAAKSKKGLRMMEVRRQKIRAKQMPDELAARPGASACTDQFRTMSGYAP
jgi:hypothetical protein